MARGYQTYGSQRAGAGYSSSRPAYPEGRRHRRPYISPYRAGVVYGYPGYGVSGWIDTNSPGYPDTIGADEPDSSPPDQAAEAPPQGYDAQTYEPWQPPRAPYQPAAANPPSAPQSEEAVTLIFKDGRPAEQIHNYVLTRTTLFVGDANRREIPTDQLDLAATARVNQDAGVDFRLPDAAE